MASFLPRSKLPTQLIYDGFSIDWATWNIISACLDSVIENIKRKGTTFHIHSPPRILEIASPLIMAANSRAFRVFLFHTAEDITESELDKLKFLCRDDLPKGELESVETPLQFLELLCKRGKICLGNVTYLENLLENAGNKQLANKVKAGQGMQFSSL